MLSTPFSAHQTEPMTRERTNPVYLMLEHLILTAPGLLVPYGITKIGGREAYAIPVKIETAYHFTDEHRYHESHVTVDKYYKKPVTLQNRLRFKLAPFHYRETQTNLSGGEIISRCFLDLNGNYIGVDVFSETEETKVTDEQTFIQAAQAAKKILEQIFSLRNAKYEELSSTLAEKIELFSDLLSVTSPDFLSLIEKNQQILDILKERAFFHPQGLQAPEFTFFSKVLQGFRAASHRSQQTRPAVDTTQESKLMEIPAEEYVEPQQDVSTDEKSVSVLGLFIEEILAQLNSLITSCVNESALSEQLENLRSINMLLQNLIPYLDSNDALQIKYERFDAFLKTKKESLREKLFVLLNTKSKENEEDIQLLFQATHEELPAKMLNDIFKQAIMSVIKEANEFNIWLCEFLHENSMQYRAYLSVLHQKIVYPYKTEEQPLANETVVCSALVQCYVTGNLEAFKMFLEHGVSPDLPGIALYSKKLGENKPTVEFQHSTLSGIISAIPAVTILLSPTSYIRILKSFSANFNLSQFKVRYQSDSITMLRSRLQTRKAIIKKRQQRQIQTLAMHETTPLDVAIACLNVEAMEFLLPLNNFENVLFAFSDLIKNAKKTQAVSSSYKGARDFLAFIFLENPLFLAISPKTNTLQDAGIIVYAALTKPCIGMGKTLYSELKTRMSKMSYSESSDLMCQKLIPMNEDLMSEETTTDDSVILSHNMALNCFLTLVIERYPFKPDLLVLLKKTIDLNTKLSKLYFKNPIVESFKSVFQQYLMYIEPLAPFSSTLRTSHHESKNKTAVPNVIHDSSTTTVATTMLPALTDANKSASQRKR